MFHRRHPPALALREQVSGHYNGIFKVRCLPGNVLATCDEDYHVRLYSRTPCCSTAACSCSCWPLTPLAALLASTADTGLLQALMLPGDASDVAMLPNGDIVTCGSAVQHGAVLAVWSKNAAHVPDEAATAQWEVYMAGIRKWVANLEKRERGEGGGDSGAAGEIELPPGFTLKGLCVVPRHACVFGERRGLTCTRAHVQILATCVSPWHQAQ